MADPLSDRSAWDPIIRMEARLMSAATGYKVLM
jgi:hypothetical protein